MEIIVEIILLLLCVYPGAFVRWLITGRKRPFSKFVKDDGYLNGAVGLISISLMVVLIINFKFFLIKISGIIF
jgi:hypothetical protein